MKLNDTFREEDQVLVAFPTFYEMMRGCAERDLVANAIKCEVPYVYIREMITGEPEKSLPGDWDDFVKLLNEAVEGDEDKFSNITTRKAEGERPEEEE